MKPMLARTLGPKYNFYPCYVQPKLNGVRAMYQLYRPKGIMSWFGVFQSRDEKIWRDKVLQHIEDEILSIRTSLGNLILDGELYVHGWKLQRINSAVAVNRKEPSADTPHVCFYVFDVVDPNRSFSDRWFEIYHGLISAELPHVRAVATTYAANKHMVDQSFNLYTSDGYEGVMLRPDGKYEFGEHIGRGGNLTQFRSKNLWKYKQWEDAEFECIGVTQGEGKADIGIGALVCDAALRGSENLLVMTAASSNPFKVGTGFSDEERIEFMQNPPIGKLVKVRYLCLTDDGIPFNPSFIAVM